jgi:hypothetical protein
MSLPDSLGAERDTFRPRRGKIIAGSILGFAAAAGGVAVAVLIVRSDAFHHGATRDRVVAILGMTFAGLGGPLIGALLLSWMRNLFHHRVTVFDQGFEYEYRDEVETCRWSDIDHVDEIVTEEELKALKTPGASPKNADRSLVVHRSDGNEFRFDASSIDRFPEFATYLEAARDQRGVKWNVVER